VNRAAFLALPGILALQNDPAQTAASPELRVLLGAGVATDTGNGTFSFNGKAYRGTFARTPDGSIVNTVDLEAYLYSVVPREMSRSWPAAALQAQAVCARTYVLQRSDPRRAYDVVTSESDQVYEGIAAESPAGRAAVDASQGLVLRYGAGFAQIMYSSCCGGHTEASSEAWGGAPFAYLGGVVCTHCTASPYYRWQRELDLAVVAAAFARELEPFGSLVSAQVGAADASGRARMVELVAQRGSAFIKGGAFRARIGARVLPSLLITKMNVSAEAPERIAIEGGGLGHGVGLCQWGARGMALEGALSTDILNLYFPGTMIGHD
jgi:stage II sporulation protein D